MKIQSIISKIVFVVFNIVMIYYFIRGFLYPTESNFWLVHYGFPIIMMEFFGVFIVLMAPGIKQKETIKKSVFSISIVLFFALVITILFNNLWIFFYFALSMATKFFIVFSNDDYEKEVKLYVTIMIALILSAFLALIFSGIGHSFPYQQELLRNKIIETTTRIKGSSVSGEIVDNPSYILSWGVIYYILLTIFHTFNLIRFQKKNTEPDLDDYMDELKNKK